MGHTQKTYGEFVKTRGFQSINAARQTTQSLQEIQKQVTPLEQTTEKVHHAYQIAR